MGPLLPILCDGHLALLCVPWLREVCLIQWKTDLRGSSELTQCAGPAAKSRDPGIYLAVRTEVQEDFRQNTAHTTAKGRGQDYHSLPLMKTLQTPTGLSENLARLCTRGIPGLGRQRREFKAILHS